MNIEALDKIDFPVIPPKTISLLTTYSCTSACKNCCFGCNPSIKEKLSLKEMEEYIERCLDAYGDSLKVLVLTGGECFLLGKDLYKIIKFSAEKGLLVRVVTNGFWAKSYEIANSKLKYLIENGLHEINFSTGDDHLKWTPYDNIVYGCMASVNLGITCAVNVERHDNSVFKVSKFFEDERLKPFLSPKEKQKTKLIIESGVWIKFDKNSEITYNNLLMNNDRTKGCKSLFTTIAINPYSQLIACCGLLSEYIKCFRLGSVKENLIKNYMKANFMIFLKYGFL